MNLKITGKRIYPNAIRSSCVKFTTKKRKKCMLFEALVKYEQEQVHTF